MLITRKFGKLVLGASTPFQLFVACFLGAVLGFIPGFHHAPVLLIGVIALILVLNCNLFLMGLVAVLAKAISLAMLPVSFALGEVFIDGPGRPLLKTMINAPVLALCGFDYYVVTGGILPALVLGVVLGLVVTVAVQRLRGTLVNMDEKSEAFRTWSNKGWVKLLCWILLGSKPNVELLKKSLGKRVGNSIRIWGAVVAAILVVGTIGVAFAARGSLLASAVHRGLERANGATVDLAGASLDLQQGRFTIEGLAMADPDELGTDRFRAARIEADLSGLDLLRKRLRLEKVTVEGAETGAARATPGKRIGRPPKEEATPPPPPAGDEKTLDDYLQQAREWRDKLETLREWLDKLEGPERPAETAEAAESLKERLAREIREQGITNVHATHLVEGSPTVLISELSARGVKVKGMEERPVSIVAGNISTQPYLVKEAPAVSMMTDDRQFRLDVSLGEAAAVPGENTLALDCRDLPLDELAKQVRQSGKVQVTDGLAEVTGDGTWSDAAGLDLPLKVALTQVQVSGVTQEPLKVDRVELTLDVTGPMDNPRVRVGGEGLAQVAREAGKAVLREKASEQIEKGSEKLGEELKKAGVDEETADKAKGLLEGIFGGKKKSGE